MHGVASCQLRRGIYCLCFHSPSEADESFGGGALICICDLGPKVYAATGKSGTSWKTLPQRTISWRRETGCMCQERDHECAKNLYAQEPTENPRSHSRSCAGSVLNSAAAASGLVQSECRAPVDIASRARAFAASTSIPHSRFGDERFRKRTLVGSSELPRLQQWLGRL
jgi:hypothetical protein